jgi:hypothetical protein
MDLGCFVIQLEYKKNPAFQQDFIKENIKSASMHSPSSSLLFSSAQGVEVMHSPSPSLSLSPLQQY